MTVYGFNGHNSGIKGHLVSECSKKEKMKKSLIMASVVSITVHGVSLRAKTQANARSGSSRSSGSGSRKGYRARLGAYDYMMQGSTSLPDTGYMPSSDLNFMYGRNRSGSGSSKSSKKSYGSHNFMPHFLSSSPIYGGQGG